MATALASVLFAVNMQASTHCSIVSVLLYYCLCCLGGQTYYYAVIATALQTALKSSPQLWMHVISVSHPSGLVFKNSCKCLKIAMNSLANAAVHVFVFT